MAAAAIKDNYAHWLEEERYKKLMFHTRGAVGLILKPLRLYGQGVYVDGAIEEIMRIFEQHGKVIRGVDVPIKVDTTYNMEWED